MGVFTLQCSQFPVTVHGLLFMVYLLLVLMFPVHYLWLVNSFHLPVASTQVDFEID